ncbi:MAG TPA: NAD-dependent epimerase/dehydratase family protein [Dehalococcoidia bacterium]|jgi:nucleoside-diphosphate-sugar epimerase|nr:NAD-dependent epimerase/dehydratase family protein [Dehalococcoidia bacterium]
MKIFVTGGTGVFGRQLLPMLQAAGHDVSAPGHAELDLEDTAALARALDGVDAVYHLATRIPTGDRRGQPDAFAENDRLRSIVTRLLVDTALSLDVQTFIYPSITFLYPREGAVDEQTPYGTDAGAQNSTVVAESEVRRFAEASRRGIILRFGLLWGPYTGSDAPVGTYGASVQIEDAGRALQLALDLPSGVYNVVADGQRISNAKFKQATGWQPRY